MHIEVSTQAKRALKKLSPAVRSSIYAELRKYSSGRSVDLKKLKGSESEWRIRIGDYRIILELWKAPNNEEPGVIVLEIVKRKDAYK